MSQCEAKRGFFTLYDCTKEANRTCAECGRTVCNEHMSIKQSICYECLAKSMSAIDEPHIHAYQLRHVMLTQHKGQSIHFGTELSEYYDLYDISSFDIKLAKITEMADSPDELFFDS